MPFTPGPQVQSMSLAARFQDPLTSLKAIQLLFVET